MTWSEAIFLALLQGITEFLPISSSGHLAFFENLFAGGMSSAFRAASNEKIAFNVLVHFGTLGSVIVFYRRTIKELFWGWMQEIKTGKRANYTHFFTHVAGTTLVTVVVGLLLKNTLHFFYTDLSLIALLFLVMALILYLTKLGFHPNSALLGRNFLRPDRLEMKSLPLRFMFLIGIAQGIAILPGISRSGITLTVALLLGLKHHQLMKYVMLISIPVVFGGFIYELSEIIRVGIPQASIYFGSILVSFATGLLSLKMFGHLIDSRKIHYFSLYLLLISLLVYQIHRSL